MKSRAVPRGQNHQVLKVAARIWPRRLCRGPKQIGGVGPLARTPKVGLTHLRHMASGRGTKSGAHGLDGLPATMALAFRASGLEGWEGERKRVTGMQSGEMTMHGRGGVRKRATRMVISGS